MAWFEKEKERLEREEKTKKESRMAAWERMDSKKLQRFAFRRIDIDRDGFITAKDIQASAQRLGSSVPAKMAADWVWEVDDTGTGNISFEDYLLSYQRCIDDTRGVEPSNLFRLALVSHVPSFHRPQFWILLPESLDDLERARQVDAPVAGEGGAEEEATSPRDPAPGPADEEVADAPVVPDAEPQEQVEAKPEEPEEIVERRGSVASGEAEAHVVRRAIVHPADVLRGLEAIRLRTTAEDIETLFRPEHGPAASLEDSHLSELFMTEEQLLRQMVLQGGTRSKREEANKYKVSFPEFRKRLVLRGSEAANQREAEARAYARSPGRWAVGKGPRLGRTAGGGRATPARRRGGRK